MNCLSLGVGGYIIQGKRWGEVPLRYGRVQREAFVLSGICRQSVVGIWPTIMTKLLLF